MAMRKLSPVKSWPLADAVFFAATVLLAAALPAAAQQSDLSSLLPGSSNLTSARIIQLVLAITVLSVAPGFLVMVTCFTRFIIALSFLRSGLGLPSTPANLVLISLALFMTLFTMAPTFDRAWESGVKSFMDNKLSEEEAFHKISDPFREILTPNVWQRTSTSLRQCRIPKCKHSHGSNASAHLNPCFHDLRIAARLEIGFLIMLPFLVIDLVTATLTMSMGMMMLSPQTISLPFKILFFILING